MGANLMRLRYKPSNLSALPMSSRLSAMAACDPLTSSELMSYMRA